MMDELRGLDDREYDPNVVFGQYDTVFRPFVFLFFRDETQTIYC